jgi:preprotein translocase subunit SecE
MTLKPVKFLSEVWEELGKITWPTRKEAIRMTLMVLIVSVVVAAFIGSLDFVLTNIITKLLTKQ